MDIITKMKAFQKQLFLFIGFAVSVHSQLTQFQALQAFYSDTNGGVSWSDATWDFSAGEGSTDLCTFSYVTCSGTAVKELNMAGVNLDGTLASSVVEGFADFTLLDLSSNYLLTGTIPTEIGILSSLEYLYISRTSLSGTIPTEFGQLTQLYWFDLGPAPSISSTLPSEFGQLTGLNYMDVSRSNLYGNIPSELGLMTNIGRLYLYTNSFSGTLPQELGNLSQLDRFEIDANSLSGSIPSQLGLLLSLSQLELDANSFTGTIPSQLGLLSSLTIMRLDTNSLSGTIPSEIGLLSNLDQLWLFVSKKFVSHSWFVLYACYLHECILPSSSMLLV